MIKKLLFVVVAIAMVLSSFASVLVVAIVAADEPSVIQDLYWWSNVSGSTPDIEFLPTPDANALFNSNSLILETIPASKDAAIGFAPNAQPDTNYGNRISFAAWNCSPYADLTSLLEFTLESVPANAKIYYANLALYGFSVDASSDIPVRVYKQLHTDWEEFQATYNIYKTGSSWTNQGGDYVTAYPGGAEKIIPPNFQGWVQWDITDIINDARAKGIPVELLIKATEYGSDKSYVGFMSKEYYDDPNLRPKLFVAYTTNSTPTPTPTPEFWSFAVITDTHIGEGIDDYGGTGWNDSGSIGQEYNDKGDPIPSVCNLRIAVGTIHKFQSSLNTKFVVVDGDLTDSAEISEFGKAKEILDVLNTWNIPWFPLIGNHDIWPYTGGCTLGVCHGTEFTTPQTGGEGSDQYFNNTFDSTYQDFANKLELSSSWKAPTHVLNTETSPNYYSYFQNLAFDYGGYHFIGLDFNDRNDAHGFKGVSGLGNLYDFNGGTWNWFTNHLNSYLSNTSNQNTKIILFAHHLLSDWADPFILGFDPIEKAKIYDFLEPKTGHIAYQFAGHVHGGNDIHPGPGFTVLKTKANKDDPMVRIVKIFPDGSIDPHTLLPEHALSITIYCPVDIVLTDPDGLVVNQSENQIPDAMYYKWDFDEDGQLETKIWIPERKQGLYSIQVIPAPGANASDTFTLTVSPMEQKWGYTPIDIAQNVTISNIPTEPYTFEFKQRMGTNISYTGAVSGYMLDTVNLTASLSTENGGSLSGKTVNFVIGNQSVLAVTDINGVATAALTLNQTYSGLYDIEYGFAGDTDCLPYYDYQFFVIPPVADAAGPYTGTEGSPITLNGSGTYDPKGKVISYEWDLDNDGAYDDTTGETPAYTWNDDYSGSIGLRVTDAGSTISIAMTTVTINNVPPTVEAGPNISNVLIDSPVSFNGSFTDPGTLDTHTIVWNFGDGSSTVNGTLTPTHTYTSSGNYIVTLTVIDDDGGVGTDTMAINMMPTTTTYTFTSGGGTHKWCSAGHIHLIDWNNGHPHSPSDFSASPTYGFVSGGSTEYTKVNSSNNVWWKSNISHDLGCCAFDRNAELFTFKITENPSTITNIQIKWEGHGTTGETIYYTTEKLWKYSNSTWNQLRNQQNVISDAQWTNNISSSCSDYIESGTGNLSVLVSSQRSGLPNNCGILTDYIEVTITHH